MLTSRRQWLVTVAWLVSVLAVTAVGISPRAAASFDAKDFQGRGTFHLVVTDARPLTPGTSGIRAQSAFASRVHGLVPGNADGIEIVFLTKPITDAALADILTNDARQLRTGEYAALVLFLDRHDRVAQVNLSYVVPGTTVGRTVAWTADDLRKHFSHVTVRGGRVIVKSKGTYADRDAGRDVLTLSWDVDLDLPVIREVTR